MDQDQKETNGSHYHMVSPLSHNSGGTYSTNNSSLIQVLWPFLIHSLFEVEDTSAQQSGMFDDERSMENAEHQIYHHLHPARTLEHKLSNQSVLHAEGRSLFEFLIKLINDDNRLKKNGLKKEGSGSDKGNSIMREKLAKIHHQPADDQLSTFDGNAVW